MIRNFAMIPIVRGIWPPFSFISFFVLMLDRIKNTRIMWNMEQCVSTVIPVRTDMKGSDDRI